MSSNIIINKRNIKNNNNSVFEYQLPKRLEVTKTDDYKISLSHLNIYLSWANISSAYNNNKFIYMFWDLSSNLVPFEITIKDGYYPISDLYEYIQKEMYNRGHYLQHLATGDVMYFFSVKSNSTYYAFEFSFFSIGQAFSELADWKTPTTWTIPVNFECMSIVFPTYGTINEFFGFKSMSIIPQNVIGSGTQQQKYLVFSEVAPQLMPSSSYLILCNLVNNEMSEEKRILTSFTIPINIYYGDVISIDPTPIYSRVGVGIYDQIRLEIVDQDYRRMNIIDPEILINLSIIKN
jgi:hypothetical protein